MNVLQIKIHEDGTLECSPDFKIIRGGYRNILLNVEVPHSLLLYPVKDEESNKDVTGNFVRVAAIIRTIVGKNLQTQKYEFEPVKDYERNGNMYRLYQRIMPKEFTLWETVSQSEAVGRGLLQLIFNVVNWTKSDSDSVLEDIKIEQIVATPILRLDVYPGAFLEDIEAVENPADYEIIKDRVDKVEVDLSNVNNEIKVLQEKDVQIDTDIKELQDKDEEIITNTENQIQAVQDKVEEDINQLREEVNEKPYFYGWFNNLEDLIANYPTATENDYAYIINGNIYEYHNNQWVDTGNKTPDNIAPLSDDDPLPVGAVASPGTSSKASKGDHVHPDSEQTKQNTIDIAKNTADISNKVDRSQIVQEVGQSESDLMSQKAVTESINLEANAREIADTQLQTQIDNKVDNSQIVQDIGEAEDKIISQKIISEIFAHAKKMNDKNEFVVSSCYQLYKDCNTMVPHFSASDDWSNNGAGAAFYGCNGCTNKPSGTSALGALICISSTFAYVGQIYIDTNSGRMWTRAYTTNSGTGVWTGWSEK